MRNAPQEYESFRNKSKDEPTEAQLQRWQNQEKIVFAAFFSEPMTMYMCEKKTGIMRPSICRFVAVWKKKDSIRVVKTSKDPYTKCTAQFLTTNPAYWTKSETIKIDKNGQTLMFQ